MPRMDVMGLGCRAGQPPLRTPAWSPGPQIQRPPSPCPGGDGWAVARPWAEQHRLGAGGACSAHTWARSSARLSGRDLESWGGSGCRVGLVPIPAWRWGHTVHPSSASSRGPSPSKHCPRCLPRRGYPWVQVLEPCLPGPSAFTTLPGQQRPRHPHGVPGRPSWPAYCH